MNPGEQTGSRDWSKKISKKNLDSKMNKFRNNRIKIRRPGDPEIPENPEIPEIIRTQMSKKRCFASHVNCH